MRESFLDREKWKVVNPSQKLYESQQPGKIEYSQSLLIFFLTKEQPSMSASIYNAVASRLQEFDISLKSETQVKRKINFLQSCQFKFSSVLLPFNDILFSLI